MLVFFFEQDTLFLEGELVEEYFVVAFVELVHAGELGGEAFKEQLVLDLVR
jgi:hypothetical protein